MWPQAKEHQAPPEAGRIFLSSHGREHEPANTFISDFWPPDCERIHFF